VKLKSIFLLGLVLFSSSYARELVDKIEVRVNGANILKSDLQKPRLGKGGQPYDLSEAISEELFVQKAAERKLLPTETELEKQIVSLKINNDMGDLSDAEFESQLQEEGFNLVEYKGQMAKMLAVEKLKHAEFNERVVVTNQQIEDHCKSNPEFAQAEYSLKTCDLSKDQVDDKGKLVKGDNLKWDDLGWIAKKDLSKSLAFVSGMNRSEISNPIKIKDDYQLIKLEDKKEEHLRTLNERYPEVERLLHEQKKEKFGNELQKDLLNKAAIVRLT